MLTCHLNFNVKSKTAIIRYLDLAIIQIQQLLYIFIVYIIIIIYIYLDVAIILEDKTFTTSVYGKPIFSRVYTHFDSFLPSTYKFGTVCTLAYRCLGICSSWTKLRNELLSLKTFFLKNGYPENYMSKCFKKLITYNL